MNEPKNVTVDLNLPDFTPPAIELVADEHLHWSASPRGEHFVRLFYRNARFAVEFDLVRNLLGAADYLRMVRTDIDDAVPRNPTAAVGTLLGFPIVEDAGLSMGEVRFGELGVIPLEMIASVRFNGGRVDEVPFHGTYERVGESTEE